VEDEQMLGGWASPPSLEAGYHLRSIGLGRLSIISRGVFLTLPFFRGRFITWSREGFCSTPAICLEYQRRKAAFPGWVQSVRVRRMSAERIQI